MMTQILKNLLVYGWLVWTLTPLASCAVSPEEVNDFNGIGPGYVRTFSTIIQGEIQFKDFPGGKIFLEARSTFPCAYGRCPVIGKDPLALEVLEGPGPYSFPLTETVENLMIIATYLDPSGGVRIAHTTLNPNNELIEGVHLSFDRPHAPLR